MSRNSAAGLLEPLNLATTPGEKRDETQPLEAQDVALRIPLGPLIAP
jgi:hypothetical protein